jgi:hypothetical protein
MQATGRKVVEVGQRGGAVRANEAGTIIVVRRRTSLVVDVIPLRAGEEIPADRVRVVEDDVDDLAVANKPMAQIAVRVDTTIVPFSNGSRATSLGAAPEIVACRENGLVASILRRSPASRKSRMRRKLGRFALPPASDAGTGRPPP